MSDEDDYNDYNQKPLEERLNYLEEDERSDSFAKETNYNKKSSKHSKKKKKSQNLYDDQEYYEEDKNRVADDADNYYYNKKSSKKFVFNDDFERKNGDVEMSSQRKNDLYNNYDEKL